MPYVADGEGFDLPFVDLDAVVEAQGAPPWRACLVGTAGMRVVLLCWPPGFATIPHHHPWAEETFLVVRGRAAMTIDPQPEQEFGAGTFLLAKRGVRHAIRVPDGGEPLLLLAAVGPNEDRPDETIETG